MNEIVRSLIEHALQDVRHAAWSLLRNPAFTAIAVVTLALGISANLAMFQLLDAVSLRPLPISSPHELAEIRLANADAIRGSVSVWHATMTNAIWKEIQNRQTAFSGLFAWSSTGIALPSATGESGYGLALLVSGEFFNVLGVRPHIGRLLTSADDQANCLSPPVVISHSYWQREFGGDPSVLGRSITLGRYPYQIVGVTPQEFTGLEVGRRFDVAVPLCAEALPPGSGSRLDSGTEWFLIVMGRLRPAMTIGQASAHLAAISPQVFETSLPSNYPAESIQSYRALQLTATPAGAGISMVREQYQSSLLLLQFTAALVLLIGCVNLANLMLARFTARERDVALRLALGAGRGRLVQMLLAESLLLSVTAAVAGSWLSGALGRFLVWSIDPKATTLFLELTTDWRLIAAITVTSIVTAALIGLVPAWRSSRVPADTVLRASARGLTEGRGRIGVRQALVAAQVCLSFVLLSGALLFGRTLNNLATQDLGLRADGITAAYVNLGGVNIPPEQRRDFKRNFLLRLEHTPGVTALAETSVIPLSGSSSDNEVWADRPGAPHAVSLFMTTSGRFFETMGVPLIAGRTFDDARDSAQASRVAVVNEAFGQAFFPGENPVGKTFFREALTTEPITPYQIVGVVKNSKYQHLREVQRPLAYTAISQQPASPTFAQLVIRTSLAPDAAVAALTTAMKQHDPAIGPAFGNLNEMVSNALTRDRLVAQLSGFFGGLGVLLATLGLYGAMSFNVALRTKEIGICMALGATTGQIARKFLGESSVLVIAGCAGGAVLTLVLGRYVRTLVFGLAPDDPVTLIGAGLLLAVVALIASGVPARRAAGLDPVGALRMD